MRNSALLPSQNNAKRDEILAVAAPFRRLAWPGKITQSMELGSLPGDEEAMSTRTAGPDTEEVAIPPQLILGRDRELSKLYALVDGIDEKGGALIIRGEPGIGKSALLAAASERAQERGLMVVSE